MSDKKTILVVDDDIDVLEQVETMLSGAGYNVVTAGGQEEAEDKIMLIKPDLAVLDLMMEQMDSGFVLCHEVKKLYPSTPVIILTAVTASTGMSFHSGDQGRAWIEADLLMDKPVRVEQLLGEVRKLLKA